MIKEGGAAKRNDSESARPSETGGVRIRSGRAQARELNIKRFSCRHRTIVPDEVGSLKLTGKGQTSRLVYARFDSIRTEGNCPVTLVRHVLRVY